LVAKTAVVKRDIKPKLFKSPLDPKLDWVAGTTK
jgi:hypothetical protein